MFKSILLQALQGMAKAEVVALFETLNGKDEEEFANDIALGYRFFKRLEVFAKQSKGKADDTIVDIFLSPIEEIASEYGIQLPEL